MRFSPLKAIALALFISTGLAHASHKCDGMQIKIENKLAETLLVRNLNIVGGKLQPEHITKIADHSVMIFTLKAEERKVYVELDMHELSRPAKKLQIKFELRGGMLHCDHDDNSSAAEGISLSNRHLGDTVTYTIG